MRTRRSPSEIKQSMLEIVDFVMSRGDHPFRTEIRDHFNIPEKALELQLKKMVDQEILYSYKEGIGVRYYAGDSAEDKVHEMFESVPLPKSVPKRGRVKKIKVKPRKVKKFTESALEDSEPVKSGATVDVNVVLTINGRGFSVDYDTGRQLFDRLAQIYH